MGLLLGLMYAQRSISIGLFLPIIIFLIITEKKTNTNHYYND